MTENRAMRLFWLTGTLRGALWSDSPTAAYEALHPLTSGPDWADDASRRDPCGNCATADPHTKALTRPQRRSTDIAGSIDRAHSVKAQP